MAYYLAETYSLLEPVEQRRIQKCLGSILNPNQPSQRLRDTIIKSLKGFESITEQFNYYQLDFVLEQMLDSFGITNINHLDIEQRQNLAKIPGVVFVDTKIAYLYGEAMELLTRENEYIQNQSLYASLLKLGSREKQAFKHWIKANTSGESGKVLASRLYIHIANQQFDLLKHINLDAIKIPNYLDEIWPDDPLKTNIAWFYRDILPLYHCLREEEQTIETCSGDPLHAYDTIQLFKAGVLVARAETPVYGQPVRYRIYKNREISNEMLYAKIHLRTETVADPQGILFN